MLYLSGIIISFFLALVMTTKRNKTQSDYILLAWIFILGFHLLTFYFVFTQQQMDFPTLVAIGIPLPLLHGPFLYLYTRQQTTSQPFHKKQLLHFIPVLISYLLIAKFFFLTHDQKLEVFRLEGKGFEIQLEINKFAIYISGVIYVSLSLIRLLKYRRNLVHQFSNTEKINFNWLLYLIFWIIAIWIVVLFVQEDKFIYGAASLFVFWLGYFGIRQVQVFSHPVLNPVDMHAQGNPSGDQANLVHQEIDVPAVNEDAIAVKYQKSTLTEDEAESIHQRLNQLMDEQKPYKNPDLTLDELAKSLEVHPNYLSQVINSIDKKSFYDLVNEKRVDAFIKSITQPISQQYTLLAIAFECGFNSKASFNRNFKKYTGYTPSDYLKMQPAK